MHQQLLHSIKSASAIKIKDQSNLNFRTIKMCYLPFYDYILFSVSYYRQKEATKGKMLCQLKSFCRWSPSLALRRESKPQLEEFAGSKILLPVFSKNNHRHSRVFCRIGNSSAVEKAQRHAHDPIPAGRWVSCTLVKSAQMDWWTHPNAFFLDWIALLSSPAQVGFRKFFNAL